MCRHRKVVTGGYLCRKAAYRPVGEESLRHGVAVPPPFRQGRLYCACGDALAPLTEGGWHGASHDGGSVLLRIGHSLSHRLTAVPAPSEREPRKAPAQNCQLSIVNCQLTKGMVKVKVVLPSRLVTEIFSPWVNHL